MRALCAVLVACVVFGACVVADHVPYRYTINLDEQPEKRYYPVVYDMCRDPIHKGAFFQLLAHLKETLLKDDDPQAAQLYQAVRMLFTNHPLLNEVFSELTGISNYFKKYCGPEGALITPELLGAFQVIYQVALQSIVDNRARDLSLSPEMVAIINSLHDTFGGMACTSIVAANSTGHVIHGRNLDWIDAHMYQPLATELTFTRGGETVAVTMSFFPELAPTALISPQLSFSYNARTVETINPTCMFTTPDIGNDPFQLIIRQSVFNGLQYNQILQALSSTSYCAPAYIVISGPGDFQGALLTTHIQTLPDVKIINTEYSEDGDDRDKWYVVVANDDTEYANHDNWSARYKQILSVLKEADQDYFTSGIERLDYDLLSINGIRRDDATCYMAAMDVRNFAYNVVVRSSTVSGNQFYQDFDIPPEDEPGKPSSSSNENEGSHNSEEGSGCVCPAPQSVSGGVKQSLSPVMFVFIALASVLLSRV